MRSVNALIVGVEVQVGWAAEVDGRGLTRLSKGPGTSYG